MSDDKLNLDADLATLDRSLAALFADDRPSPRFEGDLLRRLAPAIDRRRRLVPHVHPFVIRSAAGVAALLAIGSFGAIGTEWLASSERARIAGRGASPLALVEQLVAWDTDGDQAWSKPSAAEPAAATGGKAVNEPSVGQSEAPTSGDASQRGRRGVEGTDLTFKDGHTEWFGRASGEAGKALNWGWQGVGKDAGDGQHLLFRDGHAEWTATPFSGANKDNIFTSREGNGRTSNGSSVDAKGSAVGSDDSFLIPSSDGPANSPVPALREAGDYRYYADSDLKTATEAKPSDAQPKAGVPVERYATVSGGKADVKLGVQVTDLDNRYGVSNGESPRPTVVAGTSSASQGEAVAFQVQTQPAPEALGRAAVPTVLPAAPAPVETRKIVRTGTLEFTVDSFDKSVATVTDVVVGLGGFVSATTSNRLENGRTAGTVSLRVPPDRLDALVAALRPIGELKKQNVAAQDVTRQWTDLDGQLRAARTMEERLLKLIETGKGEVKDLVAAERELGQWRTKIEQLTGELNVLNNQVSLSTLTIVLAEKDLAAPAVIRETEQLSAGVEVEDVVGARQKSVDAITTGAKGRIIQADLKQLDAGQFTSTIVADVPPENVGPLIDRLKQVGTVARLTSERQQTQSSGDASPEAIAGAKIEKLPSRITISLYNLANVQPRQTSTLTLAPADVEKAYRAILERVQKANGRVLQSELTGSDPGRATATLRFDLPTEAAETLVAELRNTGEAVEQQSTTQGDVANTTTAKRGVSLRIVPASSLPPRVTSRATVRVTSAEQASMAVQAAALQSGGRVIASDVSRDESGRSTARVIVELPDAKADAIQNGNVRGAGDLLSFSTTQDARVPEGPLARARFELTYNTAAPLVSNDEGFAASVRHGLSVSLRGLGWSASMLVVGLCLVAPWMIVAWVAWKLLRRGRKTPAIATA